jgi:hypothetical protein
MTGVICQNGGGHTIENQEITSIGYGALRQNLRPFFSPAPARVGGRTEGHFDEGIFTRRFR